MAVDFKPCHYSAVRPLSSHWRRDSEMIELSSKTLTVSKCLLWSVKWRTDQSWLFWEGMDVIQSLFRRDCTTREYLMKAAWCSGVQPWHIDLRGSAPWRRSSLRMLLCPPFAAQCNDEGPYEPTIILCSNNRSITSQWPSSAAQCIADHPSRSR